MSETNSTAARQRIIQSLDHLSPQDLILIAELVDFLQLRRTAPVETPQPKNASLADLLDLSDSWEGDDIRDCLQLVYENRAPLEF